MDTQAIFIRTPLSREPGMLRKLGLSAEQRWVLELIDGRRSVAQLATVCSDLRYGHTALERLRLWGLIAPLAPPVSTRKRSAAAAKPVIGPQASSDDAQLLDRLLTAKPVTESRLIRAAFKR